MPCHNPNHSRSHRGRKYEVGPYTIHYSPVSPQLQFGISKNGKVVHRSRNLEAAMTWALDELESFYTRNSDIVHPLVTEAREALIKHRRIEDVAEA